PCVVGPQEEACLAGIEAKAERLGAPLIAAGQHWFAFEDAGSLVFQDENGLLDLPLPNLPGPHQIQNAGAALAALRALGFDADACEAAVAQAYWPARMQRLREGPLAESAPGAELWLDGGHNPAAGEAIAATLDRLPVRPTWLICGMLNTKDVVGFMRPLAGHAEGLYAVSIPGEANTLPADATAAAATSAGLTALTADNVQAALDAITREVPQARVLICGSLYLAGAILREND
ncbi:MAG: glutamate ligase domain-containing protein, partial [Pararhodobacter sp.]